MELNKIVLALTLIAIVILITVPTINKISKTHLEKKYAVVSKKIKEQAQNCYYQSICKNTTITIGELIEKGYLEKTIDPYTEEYFADEAYVIIGQDATILHHPIK